MVSTINTWAWLKREYRCQQNCQKETAFEVNSCCCSRSPNLNNQGDNTINVDPITKDPAQGFIWMHTYIHTGTQYSKTTVLPLSNHTAKQCTVTLILPYLWLSPLAPHKPRGSYVFLHYCIFSGLFVGLWWDCNTFLKIIRDTLSCHKSRASRCCTTDSVVCVIPCCLLIWCN